LDARRISTSHPVVTPRDYIVEKPRVATGINCKGGPRSVSKRCIELSLALPGSCQRMHPYAELMIPIVQKWTHAKRKLTLAQVE
jgi:hypothetical protein